MFPSNDEGSGAFDMADLVSNAPDVRSVGVSQGDDRMMVCAKRPTIGITLRGRGVKPACSTQAAAQLINEKQSCSIHDRPRQTSECTSRAEVRLSRFLAAFKRLDFLSHHGTNKPIGFSSPQQLLRRLFYTSHRTNRDPECLIL